MKLLITGMTSRTANPEASTKDVTFAWLMREALQSLGHDVDLRTPEILDTLEDYDHVFVGLAPLHGLGASRVYGALANILRAWGDNRLSLYVDDPDVMKVTGGIRTMTTEPQRLLKPFFAYRKEYELANQPAYAEWLRAGVKMLNEHPWPRLIVPGFAWSSPYEFYRARVPHVEGRINCIDLTSFLPGEDLEPSHDIDERWISEARLDSKWMSTQHANLPVARIGRGAGYEKRPPDLELVNLYNKSFGVIHAPVEPVGFWHSRIGYAARAGSPFVTRWQDVQPLGDSYTGLPGSLDQLGRAARADLVERQRAALRAATPVRQQAAETLEQIIKPAEVAA